jgi:hypothetical protein
MPAFLISLLLLLAGCAAATPAEKVAAKEPVAVAQEPSPEIVLGDVSRRCFPTRELVQGLFESHRETQVGLGRIRVPDGVGPAVVSLFQSPRGSWTIAVTNDEGVSCLIVWGEKWITKMPPKGSV